MQVRYRRSGVGNLVTGVIRRIDWLRHDRWAFLGMARVVNHVARLRHDGRVVNHVARLRQARGDTLIGTPGIICVRAGNGVAGAVDGRVPVSRAASVRDQDDGQYCAVAHGILWVRALACATLCRRAAVFRRTQALCQRGSASSSKISSRAWRFAATT
jgi:hypothetical protein